MPTSQNHITPHTPMGATLVDGGATFRVWAPGATQVYVALGDTSAYRPQPQDELVAEPGDRALDGIRPRRGRRRPLPVLRRRRRRQGGAEAGSVGA